MAGTRHAFYLPGGHSPKTAPRGSFRAARTNPGLQMSAVVHHGPGAFPSHLLAAEQGMGTFGDHDGLLFPVNGAGLVQAECGQGQSCLAIRHGNLQISRAAPSLTPAELSALTVG